MDNKITLNDLYRSCDIIIPEILLNALESKYTRIECIELLSKIVLTNDKLKIIDPKLIDIYIKY
jgi:hypothetical protein